MAKYQLTWMSGSTPRWRKKYKGKIYYFAGNPSKALSYKSAIDEWSNLKEQIDQEVDPIKAKRAATIKQLGKVSRSEIDQGEFIRDVSDAIGVAIPLPGASGPTLQPILDKFLADKLTEVTAGQITAGRYDNLRRALRHFADWHGERLTIDGNTIPDYRTHCLKRSRRFAYDHLASVKQFITFCWEREIIDKLPRTFKTSVTLENSKPKTWDLKVFRNIYSKAPPRLKLLLLLQINCGMYSGDISDLRQDEVDWKSGTIERSRSKTPDSEPTEWTLWPETFKLLKQYRSKDSERVLLTSTGNPLNKGELREDGRLSRSDSVRQDYMRWCKRNKVKSPPPLKLLRKTGATLLARKFGDSVAVAYLSHSPRTMAQRHYLNVSLDEALAWLRTEVLPKKSKK